MSDHQVVITGMHRSGTSLVASMAQHAGVQIGADLLGPNDGNPRGYFEDADFYRFQRRVLKRLGHGALVQDRAALGWPNPDEEKHARQLLAQRRDLGLWGWKDPRTTLFLDFWNGLLDNPSYVFLYRRPLDVVLSLQRRGTDRRVIADPGAGLDAWTTYNRCLIDFCRRHRDRCLVCEIDGVVERVDPFLERLNRFLGGGLELEGARQLLAPGELRGSRDLRGVDEILGRIAPVARETLQELDALADLTATRAHGQEPPRSAAITGLTGLLDNFAAEEVAPESIQHAVLPLLLVAVGGAAAPTVPGLSEVLNVWDGENFRLRSELEELHQDYERKAQWALELEDKLEVADRQVLATQKELDERTLWALSLDQQFAECQASYFELQNAILEERLKAASEREP